MTSRAALRSLSDARGLTRLLVLRAEGDVVAAERAAAALRIQIAELQTTPAVPGAAGVDPRAELWIGWRRARLTALQAALAERLVRVHEAQRHLAEVTGRHRAVSGMAERAERSARRDRERRRVEEIILAEALGAPALHFLTDDIGDQDVGDVLADNRLSAFKQRDP